MTLDADSFDRGWNAGHEHGLHSGAVAAIYTDVADELMRICGVGRADALMLREQALHDAKLGHPELSDVEQRALAARRIARLLLRGLIQRLEPAEIGREAIIGTDEVAA
jgi:hypothetical protein